MFKTLVGHSWQMLRRSDYFDKSMFAKAFMAFIAFFVGMQLVGLGRALPYILNENFPQYAPAQWVYGALPLILLADFIIRLFAQQVPAHRVQPYLHLPVSRSHLTLFWMIRAWLSPANVYLLFFFYAFIKQTINPATGSQTLALVGIFLLSAVSQGLLMLIRVPGRRGWLPAVPFILALIAMAAVYLVAPDKIINLSLDFFLGFVYAKPMPFVLALGVIILLHLLTYGLTEKKFYRVYDRKENPATTAASGKLESFLMSFPVYGPYLVLEWRLIRRNRRTWSGFYTTLPMALIYGIAAGFLFKDQFTTAVILIMITGSFGGFHLQHAYSWESRFFDFLFVRNFSMIDFVRAKFYFHTAIATVQLLIISAVLLFINIPLMIFIVGMTLFSVGAGYYILLRGGIRHSGRMDPDAKGAFHTEGISGMKLMIVLLQIFLVLPLMIVGELALPFSHGGALMMALPGIILILTHRSWTANFGRRLEKRKHINLALYRPK